MKYGMKHLPERLKFNVLHHKRGLEKTDEALSPASRNNFKTGRSYSFEKVNIKRKISLDGTISFEGLYEEHDLDQFESLPLWFLTPLF